MIFYCTHCWSEIEREAEVCPNCGTAQAFLKQETFEKKLIRSLKHPEPKTVIRAIKILGELKSKDALPGLYDLLKMQNDPFITAEVIKSILEIDSSKSTVIKIKSLIKIDLGILNPLNNYRSGN